VLIESYKMAIKIVGKYTALEDFFGDHTFAIL
jgi:hypothetical protein